MAWTKVMTVEMERNGQNKDIFWSSNYEDLLIDVEDVGNEELTMSPRFLVEQLREW